MEAAMMERAMMQHAIVFDRQTDPLHLACFAWAVCVPPGWLGEAKGRPSNELQWAA